MSGEASWEDAALFAVAVGRARRDNGVRHTLEDVARELDLLDNRLPEAPSEASPETPSPMKEV